MDIHKQFSVWWEMQGRDSCGLPDNAAPEIVTAYRTVARLGFLAGMLQVSRTMEPKIQDATERVQALVHLIDKTLEDQRR